MNYTELAAILDGLILSGTVMTYNNSGPGESIVVSISSYKKFIGDLTKSAVPLNQYKYLISNHTVEVVESVFLINFPGVARNIPNSFDTVFNRNGMFRPLVLPIDIANFIWGEGDTLTDEKETQLLEFIEANIIDPVRFSWTCDALKLYHRQDKADWPIFQI